jgi:hypothetical protein
MRRRWIVVGLCAAGALGFRGWAARPAKAAGITHIVEMAGGNLGAEVSSAQYRYIHSQPHHWRQCLIKN